MPKLLVKTEQVSVSLRKVTSTLKAAIVVSAAAILSRTSDDLEANAANAMGHFDDFAGQFHGIRQGMLPRALLSTTYVLGTDIEIEASVCDEAIKRIDGHLASARQAFRTVAESPERDGLDVFTESVGALGRAFQGFTALVTPEKDATPFLFDQFFLEAMQDLAQRDWSAAAANDK